MMKYLALSLLDVVFIMLINVKMPTIVGILTFMSRIKFYNLGPDLNDGLSCQSSNLEIKIK